MRHFKSGAHMVEAHCLQLFLKPQFHKTYYAGKGLNNGVEEIPVKVVYFCSSTWPCMVETQTQQHCANAEHWNTGLPVNRKWTV